VALSSWVRCLGVCAHVREAHTDGSVTKTSELPAGKGLSNTQERRELNSMWVCESVSCMCVCCRYYGIHIRHDESRSWSGRLKYVSIAHPHSPSLLCLLHLMFLLKKILVI